MVENSNALIHAVHSMQGAHYVYKSANYLHETPDFKTHSASSCLVPHSLLIGGSPVTPQELQKATASLLI